MKSASLLLMLATILITGCDPEQPITSSKHVQLEIGIVSSSARSFTDFPDEITVDLKLISEDRASELKSIVFSRSEDHYTSLPLSMPPGDYALTEFVVHEEEIEGIAGSSTSFRVDLAPGKVAIGDVVAKKKPGNPLLIAVYVEENGKKKLTAATASISDNDNFLETYQLSARTNHILFTGAPDAGYELIIEKEGYWPSSTYLQYDQLEKKRLEIILFDSAVAPGPAVVFAPSATVFYMRLQFMDTGSVVLDWRNGNPRETIEFAVDPEDEAGTAFISREMGYVLSLPPARITGDVHLIKGIYFDAPADGLDARSATGLEILSLTGGQIDILDLSDNRSLTSLTLTGMYQINTLTMPQDHSITHLLLSKGSGDTFPTETQVDYVIDNIYTNALARNLHAGSITLLNVTVSATSALKLSELQSTLDWSVTY